SERAAADVVAAEDALEAGLRRGRGPRPAAGHRVVVVGDDRLPGAPGGSPDGLLAVAIAAVDVVDVHPDVLGASLPGLRLGRIGDELLKEVGPLSIADPVGGQLLGALLEALGGASGQTEHALGLGQPGLRAA